MSIFVELSNLGPLRTAEIELADLTLLTGENNTGKTFFATVLHRLLDASPFGPQPSHRTIKNIPQQLLKWAGQALEQSDDNDDLMQSPPFEPNKEVSAWAREFTSQMLHAYGEAVRYGISYAYGAEPSRLRRKTPSRYSPKCYLRIGAQEPAWQITIRFDSDDISVNSPDPNEWMPSVLQPDMIRRSVQQHSRMRRAEPAGPAQYFRSYPFGFATATQSLLFEAWPKHAVHLPADRTGTMQSHNVLAGATARQSARAGIRPIRIESLPGTSADFLALILEIPEMMSFPENEPSQFDHVVKHFEEDLRAAIEVDQSADGIESIVAATAEGRFPMGRASSMLSELAPLLLVLKSPFLEVDHLTIDEPEAHLHPAMQVRVASFLAELVQLGMRVTLTTHSDFFVSQFNNMMRLNELSSATDSMSTARRLAMELNYPPIDRKIVRSLIFERNNGWCSARKSEPDPLDGVDETTFTRVMRSQYDDTAHLVNALMQIQKTLDQNPTTE